MKGLVSDLLAEVRKLRRITKKMKKKRRQRLQQIRNNAKALLEQLELTAADVQGLALNGGKLTFL
jgi:hypothetical protein